MMQVLHLRLFLFLSLSCCLAACGKDADPPPVNPPPPPPANTHADDLPPEDNTLPANVSIAWGTTARRLSHAVYSAEYGRLEKLGGDTLFLTYHCGNQGAEWDNIALRKSFDGGTTWTEPEIVMADNNPAYYGFANPDLQVLQNGWIMMAYTGRGNPDDNLHDNIQVRISRDRGLTWGPPQVIVSGRSWEPAILQLPDGEIQVFYSSEARWWSGIGSTNVQQEILMVRSTNNGAAWSSPKQVAYTAGMRDGMAVPLLLKDGKGIVFPIESVNNSRSPWIVWSSLSARWNYSGPGTPANNRRWPASAENIWGGAPYLVQLPAGPTLLAVQDAGGRSIGSDWKKNTMLVLVGNPMARNFSRITYPWPNLPVNEGAYYSSLFLKDAQTVVLVTTRNFADGHSEIWWKEGRLTY